MRRFVIIAILLLVVGTSAVVAQTNEFTYQGNLKDGAGNANGSYDMVFRLWDMEVGGTSSTSLSRPGVVVTNGSFAVTLSFPEPSFSGPDRWLAIEVRPSPGPGPFTTLAPRQKIVSVPYAIKSRSAETAVTATNSLTLGGTAAAQFVQTTDPRMTDARPPSAGSTNYIQNQNAGSQPSSNFHISGTGRAGSFDASVYRSTGEVILRHGVIFGHLAVGINAGDSTTKGIGNTYVGIGAGRNDASASTSTMVGYNAGSLNVSGFNNSFFGFQAGKANTTNNNSFFGAESGIANTTGDVNSFFGSGAGKANLTGSDNTFIGTAAGLNNTVGSDNTFVGRSAGRTTTSGARNTYVGYNGSWTIETGTDNTSLGANARVTQENLTYATAIGAGSFAHASNSIFLGRAGGEDTVRIPGSASVSGVMILGTLGGTNTNNHLCRNSANQIAGCTTNLAERSEVESLAKELKEQKAMVQRLLLENTQQRKVIEGLITSICELNANSAVCKEQK